MSMPQASAVDPSSVQLTVGAGSVIASVVMPNAGAQRLAQLVQGHKLSSLGGLQVTGAVLIAAGP